jgi:hypothetical protein
MARILSEQLRIQLFGQVTHFAGVRYFGEAPTYTTAWGRLKQPDKQKLASPSACPLSVVQKMDVRFRWDVGPEHEPLF